MDLGDKGTMEFSITARDAEDIARELNNDSGAGSFYGVFVAAGCEPTEAELADARRRRNDFYTKLVTSADLEGNARTIPCSSPTSIAAPRVNASPTSPGSTIPSLHRNARPAPRKSSSA
jgi:hypothetical protein